MIRKTKLIAVLLGFGLGLGFQSLWSSKTNKPQILDPIVEKLLLQASNVNDFLDRLSKASLKGIVDKSYFKNFVPVWSSFSLQRSKPHCPRILMPNEGGSLVLSVVDCPSIKKGRHDVEILQWNENTKNFETFTVSYEQGLRPQIGPKNPAKCMQCHTGGIAIGVHSPFPHASETNRSGFELWKEKQNSINKNPQKPKRYQFFDFSNLEKTKANIVTINKALAQKNHEHTVYKMQDEIAAAKAASYKGEKLPSYDEMKFSILGALMDCHNYTNMISYPQSSHRPVAISQIERKLANRGMGSLDPSERLALTLHDHIFKRVGSLRNFKRGLSTRKTWEEKVYVYTQTLVVQNIYYSFLYYAKDFDYLTIPSSKKDLYGIEKALLMANFNPIKMSFDPAWSSAELIQKMIEMDPQFKPLEFIKVRESRTQRKYPISDYIKIRSGLKPENKNISFWKKASRMPVATKKQQDQKQIYLQTRRPEFKTYCENIERIYKKTCNRESAFLCHPPSP